MHGLGIPTTRGLCIVGSDHQVYREQIEPGAMLVRMAPSHVRFGSFEILYYRKQHDQLKILADYVIAQHDPHLVDVSDKYAGLFSEVVERTAKLIAQWQAVGWAHGVMNTDNMSILGVTLDYGPFGFIDDFYISTGDGDDSATSQRLTSLNGKILRLNPDGGIPSDNPFISNADPNAKKVFSFGHRNSFGFSFHSHTGHLWQTENGPGDNDEINRVVAGANYGWPTAKGISRNPNFLDPILAYTPTIAPTGIISIPENSTVYPVDYRNNLLFSDFNGGKIRRMIFSGADLAQLGSSSTVYNGGNGFLLSLMVGADGFVYVSNVNTIFKVVVTP